MTNIAVVGAGGWGKNLIRNYYQISASTLKMVCDLDTKKLQQIQSLYPGVGTSSNFDDVLADQEVEGVVIATTGETHFDLCIRALDAGKDVYVEKPFTLRASEAEQLVVKADQLGRIVMVGHLLEYHPVVNRIKEMINAGELGEIHYMYSQRLNLGTVREDENALWNFAPHDISVILYLLDKEAVDVAARDVDLALQRGLELARLYNASLSLVHAVEYTLYLSSEYDSVVLPDNFMEIDQSIFDHAASHLDQVAKNLNYPNIQHEVLWGRPQSTVLSYAAAQNVDLIVVGSHGRHGLARLLGSTATGIAHNSKCDVIVVKLPG